MVELPHPHADVLKYEDWAGEMGARWLANLSEFEGTISPAGEMLLASADYHSGERVLDIGFGGGATSLTIAQAVAPTGEVLGIDISPDLVDATARRADRARLANTRFLCADAATVFAPDGPWDRLCSRFGSMFFPDPIAAFANLRGQLRPGGRIDLAVWGPPRENPWMLDGMAIARAHVDIPAPVPRAPGPFAYEDRDYLAEILSSSGYHDIDIVAVRGLLPVGGPGASPQMAQVFACNALAFGQVLLDYPQEVQNAVAADLVALYARHYRPGEGVMMAWSAWLVSAKA